MKYKKLLTIDRLMQLEQRLSKIPEIAQFDKPAEPQGHTLTHALAGWEDSFSRFLTELLPKLLNEKATNHELIDTVHDIGDELRHVLYHVHDVKYFRYLLEK